MTSAAEREGALRPHLDQARQQVGQLEAAVKAAEGRAHAAYVAGDVPGGDGAHQEAADLKRQLEAATARLETFETAALAIAEQKQRDTLKAELGRVREARADAVAEAQRQAAEIRPALGAAKMAVRLAQLAEDRACELANEENDLLVALGERQFGRPQRWHNEVQVLIESAPFVRDLLHLDV